MTAERVAHTGPVLRALHTADHAAAGASRGLIRVYQLTLSPLLGRACRFEPSCSAYASEALRRFGFVRGGWMALRRLLRCHPFHPGGYDPVVDESDSRKDASRLP